MIQLKDIQEALADSFFGGDYGLAGMAIFSSIMIFLFATLGRRNLMVPLVAMLPLCLVFTGMGILPQSLAVIIVLVSVLLIAGKAREVLRWPSWAGGTPRTNPRSSSGS